VIACYTPAKTIQSKVGIEVILSTGREIGATTTQRNIKPRDSCVTSKSQRPPPSDMIACPSSLIIYCFAHEEEL